ncbi:MAG: ROK family transcriptional regulator [Pirellulales bacterium]
MNERQVFQVIQRHGPASRAELTRATGISAPTVSKAVASLLESGLLEEEDAPAPLRGRPAKQLRLASKASQVLALVIDAEKCCLAAAGLHGELDEQRVHRFATPDTYEALIETAVEQAQAFANKRGLRTLGMGISLPGLLDYRDRRSVLSPNLPLTNNHTIGPDLEDRLGMECIVLQESHSLCLAEQYYGNAQGLDNFGIVDIGAGIGLGLMTGGRLLTGACGLAGEIGHITVEPEGLPCGCGNRGCLETVSSISAVSKALSKQLGRTLTNEEAVAAVIEGAIDTREIVAKMNLYLGIGIGVLLNVMNPSTLFIHSPLHAADRKLFDAMVEQIRLHSLGPNFVQANIKIAQGTKKQGAIAGILRHLTNTLVPELAAASMRSEQ